MRVRGGRCFTCQHCLTCVALLSQLKELTELRIIKVCKNNGGYKSVYRREFKKDLTSV